MELFTLLACIRCMSDCRSASIVSLLAEGGGKRAIDFYIKMSLMRLVGSAWSKAYWSWWWSVIRFQALVSDLTAMVFSCLCRRGFAGLHQLFKSSKLSWWGRTRGCTLTRYLTVASFILVILLSHLSVPFNLECVVTVHMIMKHTTPDKTAEI